MVIASREVGRRRPRALRRVTFLALLATMALACSPFLAVVSPLAAVALAGAAVAAFFACVVAVLVIEGRDEPRPGAMSVDDLGMELSVGAKTVRLRRGEFTSGRVVPRYGGGRWVELAAGDETWRVRIDEAYEAHAVLERLGLGPTRRVMRLELGSRVFRWASALAWAVFAALVTSTLTALVLAVTGLARGDTALWVVTVAAAAGALGVALRVAARFGPRAVVLGSDGVTFEGAGRYGSSRFIGYGEVAKIERVRDGTIVGDGGLLRLTLVNGEVLGVGQEQDEADALAALEEHLGRALKLHRHGAESKGIAALVRRDGRSVEAWREDLRAKVMSPVFRGRSVEPDGLLRVAEDGSAALEERVGAVLALREVTEGEGNDAVRTRVRVVVDSCADTGAREVMTAALEDRLDERDLEAASTVARRRRRDEPEET